VYRRTSEQWLAFFGQHKISGLTQTEFSKQRIDPNDFSFVIFDGCSRNETGRFIAVHLLRHFLSDRLFSS